MDTQRTLTTRTARQDVAPFTVLRSARCASAEAWAFALETELDRADWIADTTWERAGLYGHRVAG
jgi:hypothetical protein